MADNELYYIYASSAGKTPSDNISILDEGSATDKFVASLNDAKVIILSNPPSPSAPLDSIDETIKWVQQLDSQATGSVKIGDTGNIENFTFQFTQPWPLKFSSASDVLLFTFGSSSDGSSERIPPPGVDAAGQMLTLGLEAADVSGITVKDLFASADGAGMTDWVPNELLDSR